ncbi:hypothetical protein BH11VER1_BH11VER1_19940 [soil metagenome]
MQRAHQSFTVRTLFAACVVAMLVHIAASRDTLSDFSRPLVTSSLYLLGINAHDEGETIRVGPLSVPWTRDCAGVNLLLILLALGVWMNRNEPMNLRFWFRLSLLVPAALLANVARVLTIVAYRMALHPAVENPQMHYFMGLVWIVPFMTLITPRNGRSRLHLVAEGLHAAAVVALLAPMSGTPNGEIVIVAAVLALMHCRVQEDRARLRRWLALLWLAAGVAIGLCSVHSCWLPWLLSCPLVLDAAWLSNPIAWIVVVSTNAMFLLLPGAAWLSCLALAWVAWQWWRSQGPARTTAQNTECPTLWQRAHLIGITLCFVLPFFASTALMIGFQRCVPPEVLTIKSLGNEGYELRLPGQPDHIGLIWYGPTGTDRHHSVKVCLKYRGVELEKVADAPGVFTDGKHWIREFFLQNHELRQDYTAYLKSTFKPFASPGAHLMFVTACTNMNSAAFDRESGKLARELAAHCDGSQPALIARQP